jgi:hypothetical protein
MTDNARAAAASRSKANKLANDGLFHARLWNERGYARSVRDWAIKDANKAFQEFADEIGKPNRPLKKPKRK